MNIPNFFIVGFPKSGTTALHYFLRQHPDIYMPELKEPHFFSTDFHEETDTFYRGYLVRHRKFSYRTMEDYMALFSEANGELAVGEASVDYLYSEVAAENIFEFNPEAKIIISIRNPVDFIRSWYQWNKFVLLAEGAGNIEEALALEDSRKTGSSEKVKRPPTSHLYYLTMANYYNHIKKFVDRFPSEQIKVIIFENFVNDNRTSVQEIYRFLGVSADFEADYKFINKSSIPRHTMLRYLLDLKYIKKIREAARKSLNGKSFEHLKKAYDKLIYTEDQKVTLTEELKGEIREELKESVMQLDDLLHEKRLVAPDTDFMRLWGFK